MGYLHGCSTFTFKIRKERFAEVQRENESSSLNGTRESGVIVIYFLHTIRHWWLSLLKSSSVHQQSSGQVCERRKLRVNVEKAKVWLWEKKGLHNR